ncbi:putative E3 SUMO-protein ligase RNF212 [Pelodiscus sinensis]|uniref:putative E3 SUMO-protein ligase RNF212 n=1 Tax=Pelodiscus sinensis TaxID=13735 RepID=UPI000D72284C|nr:probable E3 SUMO-protein ligase RNF212 [Pelodiscus sinensis]|eukprot:XP_025041650.1 probable E3 SUMO-protein ligase RNF212 [Pelodiscus sinensis]
MAALVFCNVCFRQPRTATPRFSLTNCGHVICEPCLQKGKKDECLICRAPCRTIFLSKTTNPEIQSLFMGIDILCKKYSKEITLISEFQEKHRRRLLAYYRGKIAKLEDSLKKATQQTHPIQCTRPPQQTTHLTVSATVRNPISIPSAKQNGYSPYSLHPSCPSTSERIESMDVDHVPSPMRKSETVTGPTRLSLISPPRDGRMGSISYKGCQSSRLTASQNSIAGSLRSTPLRMPHTGYSFTSSSGSQSSRTGTWDTSGFRTPQLYACTTPSSQSSVTRQPITISSLLQRQHVGSTNLGGHSVER